MFPAPQVKTKILPAFASGELSPYLYARVDLAKYHTGVALARNFFVDYRGGLSNRQGTQFVGQCKNSEKDVRAIPFTFSSVQTYMLEFGDKYIRVVKNGAYVTEDPVAINTIANSNPAYVGITANTFADGDWLYFSCPTSMTQMNGKIGVVKNRTANFFEVTDVNGVNIDSSLYTAYLGGGTVQRIYTLVTPYAAEDLAILKFTQSADVMTLTHPSYPTQELTRTGHANWTITPVTFAPSINAPTGLASVASAAGATTYRYVVTAVSANGVQESLPSAPATSASAPMSTTSGARQTLSWVAPVTPPQYYNIYRQAEVIGSAPDAGSMYGFVGSSTSTGFVDSNIVPDFSTSPPQAYNPFVGPNNQPGCTGYFQQRQVFAGSNNGPQTMWLSKTGDYHNMDYSVPNKDDDGIIATLVSQQVNAIKHLVTLNTLLVLTASGAWKVDGGGSSDVITPSHLVAIPQAYNGCNDVPPLVINYDVLYVQAKGSIVRDLSYNFYINIYTGADLTALSSHLFFGKKIREWCWAEEPFRLVWAVRNDGVALTLTYMKEQDIYGWTRHDTLGRFHSVASISEGQEDAVYFVVSRMINGRVVKYMERLASRLWDTDFTNAWFVDSGLSNAQTQMNSNCRLTWNIGDTCVLITDTTTFTPDMVGNAVRINGGYGFITGVNDEFTAVARFVIPANSLWPAGPGEWTCTKPISVVSGLDHLEDQRVSIFADGSVLESQTVVNGTITLDNPAATVIVGLPYTGQIRSMMIEMTGEETAQGKRKQISAVTVRVYNSRGLKVGNNSTDMVEVKERSNRKYTAPYAIGPDLSYEEQYIVKPGDPIPVTTGDQRVVLKPLQDTPGQIFIQQDNPLPVTLLGLIPEVVIGD